jgi:hypothetical protein
VSHHTLAPKKGEDISEYTGQLVVQDAVTAMMPLLDPLLSLPPSTAVHCRPRYEPRHA